MFIEMLNMSGGRLAKGYPYCMNNCSYSFHDKKLLTCTLVVHISEVCMCACILTRAANFIDSSGEGVEIKPNLTRNNDIFYDVSNDFYI